MPRRSERKGMTLEEKAKFHANAIYNVPLRLLTVVDKFTFIYVPLTLGNKVNPPQIKVTHIGTNDNRYKIQYVMVERKLDSGKVQRAIIDVRPVSIEGMIFDYYEAKEGFIQVYGETDYVNRDKVSKWKV